MSSSSPASQPASVRLKAEVWDQQLCALCGSCQGLCPYITQHRGKIRFTDNCDLGRGRCYDFCPRVSLDLDSLSQAVFGSPFQSSEIGSIRKVLMARTADSDIKAKAQHGGTVSTLVCFALETGVIDGAVLTKSENVIPRGVVASNRTAILECAGANFLPAPTIEAFNREAKTGNARLGFVGLPCQVLALARRRSLRLENDPAIGKLKLTIGLFCTWSLAHEFRDYLARNVPLATVHKMDVPSKAAGVFQVFTRSGLEQIPLEEVRQFINPACAACADMTSEFADISVGVARGMPDWNTVIVRTAAGRQLFDDAVKAGVIETCELAAESLDNLKQASLRKRQKAAREVGRTSSPEHAEG